MKKYKVIIDTDPGVDDTNALLYILNDPQFDIKLFTTANGNIKLQNATRNLCHILDLLHKDIPVVEGYEKRLGGDNEDASFLHGVEGLGGYIPP
ncbi:MAG: nucleoside hydrolase, partial [Candidatus Caccovivens sp.]